MAAVPMLTVLRKVPALSKRLEPKTKFSVKAFWTVEQCAWTIGDDRADETNVRRSGFPGNRSPVFQDPRVQKEPKFVDVQRSTGLDDRPTGSAKGWPSPDGGAVKGESAAAGDCRRAPGSVAQDKATTFSRAIHRHGH